MAPNLGIGLPALVLALVVTVQSADLGFSFGTITWTSVGNVVNFTIQTAFQRPVGNVSVGDLIDLTGQESPQFLYGDSFIVQILQMTVVSFSREKEWIMGNVYLTHHYPTPTDPTGEPWKAQYVGCCRLDSLSNNAGKPWVLTADIDLNAVHASPVPKILPKITVPFVSGVTPAIFVPAEDNRNVEWSLGTPFDVGGSIQLASGSENTACMQVKIGALYPNAASSSLNCEVASSAPGCLFRLLQVNPDNKGLTVEGWLRSTTDDGGFLVTSQINSSSQCVNDIGSFDCSIATLFVKINGSHVIVGHQTSTLEANLTLVAFDPCETDDVCNMLDAYGPRTGGPLTDRWIHVAVVRTVVSASLGDCAYAAYGVQYEVFVNAMFVGSSAPLCPPQSSGSLHDMLTFGGFGTGNTELPVSLPLLENGFVGYMQEWRLWNGALSVDRIQDVRLMPLRPNRIQYSGDPTVGQVTASNFRSSAVLLADYAFEVKCAQQGCPVASLIPVFPIAHDERLRAYAAGNVTSAASDTSGAVFWRSAASGSMNLNSRGGLVLNPASPGLYQVYASLLPFGNALSKYGLQVTMYLSFKQSAGRIPVDFVVELVPATWDVTDAAYQTADQAASPTGRYIPQVMAMSAVKARTPGGCTGQATQLGSDSCLLDYVGGAVETDISACTYPACRIRGFSGTTLTIHFRSRQLLNQGNRSGFTFGAIPPNALLSAVDANTLQFQWQPCLRDIGFSVVCLDSFLFESGLLPTSQMVCFQFEIVADPDPELRVAPSGDITFTMGRKRSFALIATSANCMQQLSIQPVSASSLPAGMLLHTPEQTEEALCTGTQRMVEWQPVYDVGGLSREVCFAASQTPTPLTVGCPDVPLKSGQACVNIRVERCRYALGLDQELQQVAAAFATDWMRIWSLNAEVLHPDYVVYADQVLWVGHLLRAVGGETPAGVAQRMGMELKLLQMLNNDINTSLPLQPGQVVCVVPNSCGGTAATVYTSIDYKDDSFFASQLADTTAVPGAIAAQLMQSYPPL